MSAASCDVCNAATEGEAGTLYTAEEIRRLVALGFRPDESALSLMAAFGISASEAAAQWKQQVDGSRTDWLLCPACADRAGQYLPKPRPTPMPRHAPEPPVPVAPQVEPAPAASAAPAVVTAPPAAEAEPKGLGEFDRLTGVLFDPKATFPDIVARPRWWVPVALLTVLTLSFLAVFDRLGGWEPFFHQQLDRNERVQQLPVEQRERILEQQLRIVPIIGYIQGTVGVALFAVVLAGILLFVFNILAGQNLEFRKLFAVTCYSLLPLGVNSVLALVVFLIKGPEDFDLQNPVATNVGAFLDPGQVPSWVVSVASSIDIVSFWVVLLLATGIAAAGRRLAWNRAFGWMLGTWMAWMAVKGLGSWIFS